MSLLLRYSDPRGISEPAVFVSLGSNVRFGQLGVTLSAEVGDPAMSTVTLEDPGGVYDFAGLRAFDVRETSAPSNNSIIGRFAIQDRMVSRSPERGLVTGADRLWSIDLTDFNWHLASRILTDSDANRPVETAGDRIRWLLHSAANIALYDYGNVSYPSASMDATDYRGQRPADLLADCAVESGYNFWCDVNEAHGRPELFFMDPNGASYTSAISVSNVVSDVDSTTIFAPTVDAELRRSPSRLAYGVYLAYANGSVYVRNSAVGLQFGSIDQSAPMSNVKTAARARRVATKFLNDNDEEDDRLAFAIDVPAAQVNDVRHGHRMAVRFSHLPGYETARDVRVVKKTVIQQESNGRTPAYRLAIEAVNVGVAVTTPAAPTVRWLYYAPYGALDSGVSIQASDDGASWSTIATNAALDAGTTNPPNATPGTYQYLVEVPEADWQHRYWRIRYTGTTPSGLAFYAGVGHQTLRLLSTGSSSAVDRLGGPWKGSPFDWWVPAAAPYSGDVAYSAVVTGGATLYTGSNSSAGTSTSERQGTGGFGINGGVFAGPVAITANWVFDIGVS